MEIISLQQVLPAVFAQTPPGGSDVWLTLAEFHKGKTCLIEAASGIGKSSLCSYLYGYRRDYSGTIGFDGRDIRSLAVAEWSHIRRTSLAMMFQDLRLFPEISAIDNVKLKNNLTRYKTEQQIADLFSAMGIGDKVDRLVGKLSYGQQQRVAFIRMLCQQADFFILDEPVSHLDDANSEILARILHDEAHEQHAGIIVTSIGQHPALDYDKTLTL